MGILRRCGRAGFPDALFVADVIFAPGLADKGLSGCGGFVRNAQTVGTHIGDQTDLAIAVHLHTFIQALGGTHGAGGRKPQCAAGILLQGGGDERWLRLAAALALIHTGHGVGFAVQRGQNGIRLFFIFHHQLGAVRLGCQPCVERTAALAGLQVGVNVPVFFGLKVFNFDLAVADNAHRHALHAASRKPAAHLMPQKRAELITHQAIQRAPGLLGVEQIHINGARVGHTLLHALFGDLVKGHAVGGGGVQPQHIGQMPADCLAFTVRVGCQIDGLCFFRFGFQVLDQRSLAFDGNILWGIAMFHINAQRAGGQVPDMAHAGRYSIAAAQVFANGLCLGRGFHDHQLGAGLCFGLFGGALCGRFFGCGFAVLCLSCLGFGRCLFRGCFFCCQFFRCSLFCGSFFCRGFFRLRRLLGSQLQFSLLCHICFSQIGV